MPRRWRPKQVERKWATKTGRALVRLAKPNETKRTARVARESVCLERPWQVAMATSQFSSVSRPC